MTQDAPAPWTPQGDGPDPRRHAPATLRNRDAIAAVLRDELPDAGLVLEVASGSGEHVVHFAVTFPALDWQPSDPDPAALASIAALRGDANLPNLRAPLLLDAAGAVVSVVLRTVSCARVFVTVLRAGERRATDLAMFGVPAGRTGGRGRTTIGGIEGDAGSSAGREARCGAETRSRARVRRTRRRRPSVACLPVPERRWNARRRGWLLAERPVAQGRRSDQARGEPMVDERGRGDAEFRASFREPGCHHRLGDRWKALWLCVTDFRRVCRFEKHLVGAETPKSGCPCGRTG